MSYLLAVLCALACLLVVFLRRSDTRLAGALLGVSIVLCTCPCHAADVSVAAIAQRRCCTNGVCATAAPPVSVSAIAQRQTPVAPPAMAASTPRPPQMVQYGTNYVTQPQCVGGQCAVPQRRGLFRFGR